MSNSSGRPHREDDDDEESSQPSAPDPGHDITPSSNFHGTFTWSVALPAAPADKDSLADISKIRQFSSVFEVGGYEWKLEMYPYGDSQSDKTLSVFLCAVDSRQLPGWSQTAHYQIAVVNKDPAKTSTHTGYDIFRGKRDSAWGWSKLISLTKLHDVSQGWVDEEGKITLQATVHVVTHEYMPVNRTYRKSLCGLYYERVLQGYFEPFLKDELQRLDKLCGNSVLHKGFSDFWTALPDAKKRSLLQITVDEVLLNVKARLFSRDQPATYLAADVIFKAAKDCTSVASLDGPERALVGCTSLTVIVDEDDGMVLKLEKLTPDPSGGVAADKGDDEAAGAAKTSSRVMIRTQGGVMRMSNTANFVDVFRAQVSDALDNVLALVKHLKPQTCDGTCLEAMGRHMLAVFAMCGMYITNVHPAYHQKLALQLQEDLIREEEENNLKKQEKKAKQAEKKKKQSEIKAQRRMEEEAQKKKLEEEEKRKKEEELAAKKAQEEQKAKHKAETRKKMQEEAERQRLIELQAEEERKKVEAVRKAEEEKEAKEMQAQKEEEERNMAVSEPEQAKRCQIAGIMRSTELSAVEKQTRIQAILAGKIEWAAMAGGASAASTDFSTGPAARKETGRQEQVQQPKAHQQPQQKQQAPVQAQPAQAQAQQHPAAQVQPQAQQHAPQPQPQVQKEQKHQQQLMPQQPHAPPIQHPQLTHLSQQQQQHHQPQHLMQLHPQNNRHLHLQQQQQHILHYNHQQQLHQQHQPMLQAKPQLQQQHHPNHHNLQQQPQGRQQHQDFSRQVMPWHGGGMADEYEQTDEVDVEAFALTAIGGESDDDVMAMALGSSHMQMPHQTSAASDMNSYDSYSHYTVPAAHSAPMGSRLFERWAAPAHEQQLHHGHHVKGGIPGVAMHLGMGLPNGSDSEASMASTASGTRTPVNLDCFHSSYHHR